MEQGSWDDIRIRQKILGPPPWRQLRGCLVVGWDRNASSSAALRYAVQLADLLALHIHLVHAVELDDTAASPDISDWEERLAANLNEEAVAAERLLTEVDTSWTYYTAYGDPGDLLAEVADRCQAMMVVVGGPRRGVISFLEGLSGRSVARRVIGKRRLPVLVVPDGCHPADTDGW